MSLYGSYDIPGDDDDDVTVIIITIILIVLRWMWKQLRS